MFVTQHSPILWLIRAQKLATDQLLEAVSHQAEPLSSGLFNLCLQAEEDLRSNLQQLAGRFEEAHKQAETDRLECRQALELAWQAKPHKDSCLDSHLMGSEPATRQSNQQLSILIIDDDADNLLVAQYVTEDLGYRVTTVLSGHEAVETAIACRPDVILLDIWLDGITGVEVFQQLRQQPEIAKVPVIAVTALALPAERDKIMAAGFSDYVLKPYMVDDLSQAIERHLP